ncbi:TOMM precursor leader peptide-binding protein [Dictyobacter kobayashii]|uniref:YcaO domain-containing protein n=1 Tax=Dictyobacter kobayashii TaxID=2014872 RepID=A0A402ATN3_9CHLR|nr:TOMM precursor leader peptide-binding protein [Dictyobacter kobayashii]GCE22393.1 hypothetical protein KDK_61930 [Dictyobacter kobayashii]
MQPKFKSETCYIPIRSGIYLRNNHGGLWLKGESLHRLLEHLVPTLDGHATLEEITDGLDISRKKMITNLIEKLSAHRFLQDVSQDQTRDLSPLELETYSSDLAFIESFQNSAAHRFEHFRNQRLLIIGSGLCFSSLIHASLQRGIKVIGAIMAQANNAEAGQQALFYTNDPEQTVQLLTVRSWDDEIELRDIMQTYDTILLISDRPLLARLLNRLCVRQKKIFIPAIMINNHAWVGPLVHPKIEACWECAWRRLQSNLASRSGELPHYEFSEQTLTDPNLSLTRSAASIIANRLVFEVFKYFTHIGYPQTSGQLIDIDLATFQSKSHSFLSHHHCLTDQHPILPTAQQFLEQVEHLQHRSPINTEAFLDAIARYTDEKLGLFTSPDAEDFVQVPLGVYRVQITNPMLIAGPQEPLAVVAASINTTSARLRACQEACEYYMAEVVDQRRLLTLEQVQQQALSTITTAQLVDPSPAQTTNKLWTWALNLHTNQACVVPAEQVFYSLHHNKRATVHQRGIASGMNWDEAVCLTLLDWCRYLTIERLSASPHPYPQVDLASTLMTAEGRHLYRLLQIAVEQFTVYDVTGTLQVPTFAICVEGKVIAYSTHCDVALALSHGLEQALQQYQSVQFQQPEYAIVPVPDLPGALRGKQVYIPEYTLPEAWSARLGWLIRTLQAHNLRAFVVPLDHDPALTQAFPYIMRALLSRAEV